MTLIASLSTQGMGEAFILDGAADGAAFEIYVEQLLAPSLRPGQIVILDNLSIHQGPRVKQAIEARGCHLVQRFMVVDNLDFSPTRLTAFSVRRILAFRGALPSPHFSTTRILMALHVFVFVFLLVVCLLFSLALLWRLDRFHLRPFFSRGEAKRSSLPRLLKPRTPDACPACRLASTASSAGEPAPVRPWCEVKGRRGAPKRIPTEGFACPNKQCRYFGNTDAHRHALVGDGKHGKAEPIQTFRCQACHTTFTSRRNTPLYRLKTPSSHVAMVLSALAEGLDPSAAERVFGIRQATMTTWLTRSGEHAQTLHEHVFCHLHLPYLQLDELRTRLRSHSRVLWLWLAIDPRTKILPVLHLGPRTQNAAHAVIHSLRELLAAFLHSTLYQ
jgi:transposase-like protein